MAKAGADLLVIHTRTAAESFYKGRAIVRWSWIDEVKKHLKESLDEGRISNDMKVYCNGEAKDPISGKKMLEVSSLIVLGIFSYIKALQMKANNEMPYIY